MDKKNFSGINTNKADTGVSTGKVYEGIEKGKSAFQRQPVASEEEQRERKESFKTQGRKGCKEPRINMAITPTNYEYISIVAAVMGKTKTGFVNWVLEQYRQEHPDIYESAKQVIELAGNTGKNE